MATDRHAQHGNPARRPRGLPRWRWKRGWPTAAAVVVLVGGLIANELETPATGPLIVLALVLVGLAASRGGVRLARMLGLFSGAALAGVAVVSSDADGLIAPISGFAIGMLPALIGQQLRTERAHARDARELARRVEELRDRDVQRAVAEERLRIARDVHDVTGHHLSAISLQAAGAGRTTADPAARAALERIHGLSREALSQTRRALGVLRAAPEPAALAPPPRLAHVDHLLAPACAAGIAVELRRSGTVRELSETVEMCAYRVVQESLTNVVRHAGARSVRVVLDYGAKALTVAVEDDGASAEGRSPRAGSGIEGMRERVALVGGSLAAGPRDGADGGWSVLATLPLEGSR